MPIINGKKVTAFPGLYVKSKDAIADAVIQFANVTSAPTTTTGDYYLYVDSGVLKFDNGSSAVSLAGGSSGTVPSWDTIYGDDKTLTLNSTTLTFALTHATNNGLTVTGSAGSAGHCLQITNAGTGNDVNGTSGLWSITKAGLATFTTGSILGGTTLFGSGSATGTISSNGAYDLVLETNSGTNSMTVTLVDAANGDIDVVMNGTGKIDMSGTTTHNTAFKVGAGDMELTLGNFAIISDWNTEASLSIQNDTATTIGAAADLGVLHVATESLTTGVLLNLSTDETNLAGGYFFRCYSQDAGAAAFTIGEKGATVIAGVATGTAVVTLKAGNLVMSDGAMSLTQSADATALTIVADAVTTGNVIDVNADAVTSGTVLHLDTTAATFTGLYIDCYDGAASDFSVGLYGATIIAGNAATNVLTLTAGNIVVTAGDLTLSNGSISLTNTADETVLTIVGDAVTTGNVIDVNADAVTSGTVLHLDTTAATFTGLYLDCYDGAASDFSIGLYGATIIAGNAGSNVFTVTAGDLVVSDGSLTMTDADEASTLAITNNTAASVAVVSVTANAITGGDVLKLESSAAEMTTGNFINCYNGAATVFEVGLYGATTITGNAATNVLTVTAGHLVLTSGNATLTSGNLVLTLGNATLTDGNLTLSEGKVDVTSTTDERVMSVVGNVTGASQEPVLFQQDHTGGAVAVVKLVQDDVDDSFINFSGTAGAGSSLNTNTTSGATTHHIKIEINGTAAWIAASTNTPS